MSKLTTAPATPILAALLLLPVGILASTAGNSGLIPSNRTEWISGLACGALVSHFGAFAVFLSQFAVYTERKVVWRLACWLAIGAFAVFGVVVLILVCLLLYSLLLPDDSVAEGLFWVLACVAITLIGLILAGGQLAIWVDLVDRTCRAFTKKGNSAARKAT